MLLDNDEKRNEYACHSRRMQEKQAASDFSVRVRVFTNGKKIEQGAEQRSKEGQHHKGVTKVSDEQVFTVKGYKLFLHQRPRFSLLNSSLYLEGHLLRMLDASKWSPL